MNNLNFPENDEEVEKAKDFLSNFQINGAYKYIDQLVCINVYLVQLYFNLTYL